MAGNDKRYKIELWKKGSGETILEKFNEEIVNENITDANGVVDDNRIRSALAAIKREDEKEEELPSPPIDGGSLKKKSQNNSGKRKSKKKSTRNKKREVSKKNRKPRK